MQYGYITEPPAAFDQVDNRISPTLRSCKQPYINIMMNKYHREDERLKVFDNWKLGWLDKNQLAQSAMFYTNEEDKVKCYFCEVEIGRWEPRDQPVSEHLKWSPNCPLLRRRTTNNVPLNSEALDQILPAVSYDIFGANDTVEVRELAYAEGRIPLSHVIQSTGVNTMSNGPLANGSFSLVSVASTATSTATQATGNGDVLPEVQGNCAGRQALNGKNDIFFVVD